MRHPHTVLRSFRQHPHRTHCVLVSPSLRLSCFLAVSVEVGTYGSKIINPRQTRAATCSPPLLFQRQRPLRLMPPRFLTTPSLPPIAPRNKSLSRIKRSAP